MWFEDPGTEEFRGLNLKTLDVDEAYLNITLTPDAPQSLHLYSLTSNCHQVNNRPRLRLAPDLTFTPFSYSSSLVDPHPGMSGLRKKLHDSVWERLIESDSHIGCICRYPSSIFQWKNCCISKLKLDFFSRFCGSDFIAEKSYRIL